MKIFGSDWRFERALLISLMLVLAGCVNRGLDAPHETPNASIEKQDVQRRAAIRIQLAVGYYQQGQNKVALEEIRQALLISPDLLDAYAIRALIFMEMGEKKLAEENFLYAMKLAPNDLEIANNYGWFLCQNDREKQGLVLLERALHDSAYPTPAKAYNNAGLCSLRIKDARAAEAYFMQGFRIDPSNPGLNANLARVFFDRGDFSQARFYINRVLKLDVMTVDVLWLAIRIEKKLGDEAIINSLTTQLRRRFPNSREFGLLQRGSFDE